MLRHQPKPDEPTPVLPHQRDLPEIQVSEHRRHPGHVALIGVIGGVNWLVRFAKPHQVGGHHPVSGGGQGADHLAVEVAPTRLPMQQEDGGAVGGPLVEVVHPEPLDLEVVRLERVAGEVLETGFRCAERFHDRILPSIHERWTGIFPPSQARRRVVFPQASVKSWEMARRALPWLCFLATACATAPAPRMSLAEAGFAPGPAPRFDAPTAPRNLLRINILRFAAVERILRDRFRHQAMPEDAEAAWRGLFSAVDRSLEGAPAPTTEELLEAQRILDGELWLDEGAYLSKPRTLWDEAQARTSSLELVLRKRSAWPPQSTLRWPVDPVVVTSPFGQRLDPVEGETWREHLGVDLDAPTGEPVVSAGAGEVIDAGNRRLWPRGRGGPWRWLGDPLCPPLED